MKRYAKEMKIKLYDNVGTGLIVPYNSGIIYSNQTGGTSCLQPEMEGAFIPWGNDVGAEDKLISNDNDLYECFCKKWEGTGATHGIDEEDADYIDSLFKKWNIKVNRNKLRASHEAWVWVILEEGEKYPILETSFPCEAVLTWTNSD